MAHPLIVEDFFHAVARDYPISDYKKSMTTIGFKVGDYECNINFTLCSVKFHEGLSDTNNIFEATSENFITFLKSNLTVVEAEAKGLVTFRERTVEELEELIGVKVDRAARAVCDNFRRESMLESKKVFESEALLPYRKDQLDLSIFKLSKSIPEHVGELIDLVLQSPMSESDKVELFSYFGIAISPPLEKDVLIKEIQTALSEEFPTKQFISQSGDMLMVSNYNDLRGAYIAQFSKILVMNIAFTAAPAIVRQVIQDKSALLRMKAEANVTNKWGEVDPLVWKKSVLEFLVERVGLNEKAMSSLDLDPFVNIVDGCLNSIKKAEQSKASLEGVTTGVEYEHYLMQLLAEAGIKCTGTKASGDQGADLLVEGSGERIVVQAKFYSSPVGNDAVQQAHAAKGFYNAQYAMVVTNAGFTTSAKVLANRLDVLILHHDELVETAQALLDG